MAVNNLKAVATTFNSLLITVFVLIPLARGREICRNNGTLKTMGREQMCLCPHPFTGQYCEDYACVNGLSTGLQYNRDSPFFNKRCLCDPGWTGSLCSISLHNRCGENGIEVNGKCQCNKNFIGDRCEYVTRCTNGQLYNGRCACHYGWAGNHCDQIICHQGYADESNKACICPAKYRGKYCDFCTEPSSSPLPECAAAIDSQMIQIEGKNEEIIAAIVVVTILLVLGIIFCLFRQKVAALSKTQSKKMMMRQAIGDVEIRSNKAECENRPLNCTNAQTNGKETVADSDIFFHSPPPPYYFLVPAQKEPYMPQNGAIETKPEAGSSPAEATFFLGERSTAIEKVEQQKQKPIGQSDETEAKDSFPDEKLEEVDSLQHVSNI